MAGEDDEVAAKLKLKGRREFKHDVDDTVHDIRRLGGTAKVESRVMSGAFSLVSRGMSALTGMVTRGARRIALGLAAVAAAAVAFGVKNLAAYETAEISFTRLLGSHDKAMKMLTDLQQFAKVTPFEFPELLTATQRMMAYGFAADEIIPLLTRIGDAAAGLNLGPQGIQRITTAIGQIRAKGVLQAEEMRQLAEAGIPAWEFLAKRIGVSIPEAMKLVERRMVPGSVGINAVLDGIGTRFSGMMEEQAKTITGLWSNLKDSLGIATRQAVEPFKDTIKDALRTAIRLSQEWAVWIVQRAPKYIDQLKTHVELFWIAWQNGGIQAAGMNIASLIGGQGGADLFDKIWKAGANLWTVITQGVLPAMRDLNPIITALTTPLSLVDDILKFMAGHIDGVRTAVKLVVGAWAAYHAISLLVWAADTRAATARAWLAISTNTYTGSLMRARVAQFLYNNATIQSLIFRGRLMAMYAAEKAKLIAQAVITKGMAAAQWLLNAAMSANPVMLLVIAIGLLIAGLVYAYQHSETFRNIVNAAFRAVWAVIQAVWHWIRDNWPLLLAILTGPVGLAVLWIVRHWDTIVEKAKLAFGALKDIMLSPIRAFLEAWNKLDFTIGPYTIPGWIPGIGGNTLYVPDLFPDVSLPFLHQGGMVTAGGATVIKPEEEAVVLPRGASVEPLPAGGTTRVGGDGFDGPLVLQLIVDGKKMAETTVESLRDKVARK